MRDKTTKEIAVQHGVSPRTVRKLAANGELPADKIGKQYRFDENEVARAIQFSRSSRSR
ncbi:MAG TPA: helix-turn-helix domain-containing protein [Pirellulales bacterium]|nr:helix-turn-helix domain-containing protein [Pirellulales bacterium]